MPLLLQVVFLQVPLVLGDATIGPGDLNAALIVALKLLFYIAGFLYVAFSVVVIRQIHTMQTTLVTSLSPALRLLGYLHLAASLAVMVFMLLVL